METRARTGAAGDAKAGQAVKRRGILAAAGAVVAGLLAKGAERSPVAANDGVWQFPYTGLFSNDTYTFKVTNNGTPSGGSVVRAIHGIAPNGIGIRGESTDRDGVSGSSTDSSGVYGLSTNNIGVYAESYGRYGVYGATYAAPGSGNAGVVGQSNGSGTYGVVGNGRLGAGTGVLGQVAQYGVVGTVANIANTVAVTGDNASANGTNNLGVLGKSVTGIGVQGQSTSNVGIYGLSNASYGIVGVTSAGGPFSGITGGANANGAAAFAGGTSNPLAYAAYFSGRTVVQGDFTVVGGAKNAAVKHPDGSYRLLHCVESPEAWFEDFGEGTLSGGRAEVKMDPDFAAVVETSRYHVFLTMYDTAQTLFVTNRGAGGFVVQAERAVASGAFGWRVVAKRKDLGKVQRLAKFVPPNLTIPGIGDLPKAPDPPAAAPSPAPPPRSASPVAPPPPTALAPAATVTPPNPNPAPPPRT